MDDITSEHDGLCERLDDIPTARWREPGVWGDKWTLADLVAHLAEWQSMFLTWYRDGEKNLPPQMPAPGYKWNEVPKLNRVIWKKHHKRSLSAIRSDFDAGYDQILTVVTSLSQEQILAAGHFFWTGKHPLASYLGPNTASHYRFASKAIKRWLRNTSVSAAGKRRAANKSTSSGKSVKKSSARSRP